MKTYCLTCGAPAINADQHVNPPLCLIHEIGRQTRVEIEQTYALAHLIPKWKDRVPWPSGEENPAKLPKLTDAQKRAQELALDALTEAWGPADE